METLQDQIARLRADPASEEAAHAVRLLGRSAGAFADYAGAFAERASALAGAGEVERAIGAHVEAALVYEEDLGALGDAANQYEAVLELQAEHRRALFSLGLLLHDLGRWEDLIALYKRRIASTPDTGEQTTLHLYSAEILAERLGDDNAAFVEVMAAARLAPQNLRIIGRLEKLGARTNRHLEVAVTIGDLILHQDDPKVRAALSLRLAELHLGPLEEEHRALAYLKAALADDGGNPEILHEMEDVFRERDRFDALAELLEHASEDRRVGPHRVRLQRELARIYELELGDVPRALSALTRALEHAPEDRELLDEVMRLGLESGDLASVAQTYERVAQLTENALLQTYMRLKLGHIYGNVLNRPDDAVRVYWAILEQEPAHAEARRRLMRIHDKRGDHEDMARLLELEVSTLDGAPEAQAPLERLLHLYTDRIDDPARAVEASRRLLELDPEHPEAKGIMELYPNQEAPAPSSDAVSMPDVGDSAVMTADEAPTEFDGEGYGPESETLFAPELPPVVAAAPPPTPAPPPVVSVADLLGEDDDFHEEPEPTLAVEEILEVRPLPESERLHAGPVDEVEAVIAEFQVASEALAAEAPEPPSAEFEVADDILASVPDVLGPGAAGPELGEGDSEDEVLVSVVESEDAVQAPARVLAGEVFELGDGSAFDDDAPEDAAFADVDVDVDVDLLDMGTISADSAVEAAQALPGQGVAAGELAEAPAEAGDADGASDAAALEVAAEDAVAAEVVDTGAVEAVAEASDTGAAEVVDTGAVEAVDAAAVEAEDAVGSDGEPPAAPFLGVMAEAAAALEEKGETEGGLEARLAELARELEEATAEDDTARAVAVLEETVAIAEGLEAWERAFFAQARLTELDPTEERLEALLEVGRQAEGYPMLIELVDRLSPQVGGDAELRFGLELVGIELDVLQDVSAAVGRLAHLYEVSGHQQAILGRWLSVLEEAGRYSELVQVLLRRADDEEDRREALLFAQRAVSVLEVKLQDPSGAADVLLGFLARHPEHEELEAQAIGLLEAVGRHGDLAALYRAQIERLDGAERAAVRLKLAALLQDELQDSGAAEANLRDGLQERARDPGLMAALWDLLEGQGRHDEQVDVGLRWVEVVEDAGERAALRRRLAEVADLDLEDGQLAEELLGQVLAEDPHDLQALLHLERLRRAREDWEGVHDLLELQASAAEAPADKARATYALAQLKAERRGDLDGAVELLRQTLALAPEHDDALGYLAELEERRGDYVGAVDVLRAHVEARPPERRAPVHVHLGALLLTRFQDLEGAREQLEAGLDLLGEAEAASPLALDARQALLSIAEREGDFVRAHALAVELASATDDPRVRAERWVRAGQLAEDHLGDERRAIEAYERALAADPDDLATEATLGELWLRRGAPEAALPHLLRAAAGLSDPERAVELYMAAGRAAERCGHADDARVAYAGVLEHHPTEQEALERASDLFTQVESWDRAYDAAAALILHHEARLSVKDRAQVYLRMAQARHGQGDGEAALRLAQQAHQLDGGLERPLALMAELLEAQGEAFEAAEALKRLAPLVEGPDARTEVMLRAGRLLQEQAQDPARAAAMLTEAQTLSPDSEEVAQRLAVCRGEIGDAEGAASALEVLAHRREGRPQADLLVQAARALIGAGRARARARALLQEALQIVPTHLMARKDLEVVLEFDGDLPAVAALWTSAAERHFEGPVSERDLDGASAEQTARALLVAVIELYRDRLADPVRALKALKTLMTRDGPDAWQELYARLLDAVAEQRPEQAAAVAPEAIAAWSGLVEARPGRVEGLSRLYALRQQTGEVRLARAAGELLMALGHPGPSGGLPNLGAPSGAQAVSVPPDPAEKNALGELLERLGHAPMRALQDVLLQPRPKKKDRVGPAGLGIHVSRPLELAARILGQEVPTVYVREDAADAVEPTVVGDEPALMVSLGKAQERSEEELRFLFGRSMSLLRPRALSLAALPMEALREAMVGLARVPEAEAPLVDVKSARRRGKALERALPAAERAAMAEAVAMWLATPGRRTLGQERRAVLRTAERAGMVVSGSLQVALDTLTQLSGGRMERGWRLPLIRFAATREYAEILRRIE
ncbi:MAG: tetratricopeptide repeat protein [Myxococcales bacterium]|nr:tetratricopeptide repeat protein [Myxococcales bacterium]